MAVARWRIKPRKPSFDVAGTQHGARFGMLETGRGPGEERVAVGTIGRDLGAAVVGYAADPVRLGQRRVTGIHVTPFDPGDDCLLSIPYKPIRSAWRTQGGELVGDTQVRVGEPVQRVAGRPPLRPDCAVVPVG